MIPLVSILGGLAECRTAQQVADWKRDTAEHVAALPPLERKQAEDAFAERERLIGAPKKGKR